MDSSGPVDSGLWDLLPPVYPLTAESKIEDDNEHDEEVLMQVLRGHNWMGFFPKGHSVLLP